jgi:hypothetical protein
MPGFLLPGRSSEMRLGLAKKEFPNLLYSEALPQTGYYLPYFRYP